MADIFITIQQLTYFLQFEICMVNLLNRLNDDFNKKRSHFANKKLLFRHENAGVHTSVVDIGKFHKLFSKLLRLASYFLDLAPSDYLLFPNLKK